MGYVNTERADILARLQKEILPLQGYKPMPGGNRTNIDLGAANAAFPNACFPLGAVHEFQSQSPEQTAASAGFVAAMISHLAKNGEAIFWISRVRRIFPPALKSFGIEPDRVIFINAGNDNDLLWVMEEGLKCKGLAAVVGEIAEISFTASRRLQLAVEQSRVTGFLIRQHHRLIKPIASVCRWRISHLPSEFEDGMPGVGFPRWNVALEKVRNGKPGEWQMEWSEGRFNLMDMPVPAIERELNIKVG
jgi:protein ImuA